MCGVWCAMRARSLVTWQDVAAAREMEDTSVDAMDALWSSVGETQACGDALLLELRAQAHSSGILASPVSPGPAAAPSASDDALGAADRLCEGFQALDFESNWRDSCHAALQEPHRQFVARRHATPVRAQPRTGGSVVRSLVRAFWRCGPLHGSSCGTAWPCHVAMAMRRTRCGLLAPIQTPLLRRAHVRPQIAAGHAVKATKADAKRSFVWHWRESSCMRAIHGDSLVHMHFHTRTR